MSGNFRIFVCKCKRMSGLSLWAFPKRYKSNKEGKCPLFLRISLNGDRAEIALKRYVNPNLWDNKRQLVKGRNVEASSINDQIRVFKTALYNHFTELVRERQYITPSVIKNAFENVGNTGKSLLEVFSFHNEQMKGQVGEYYAKGTFLRYETCFKLLKEFLGSKNMPDILLKNIKYNFITDFDYFLRTVRKCNNNTTIKYIKNLRKIINMARANEWMTNDPFLNFKGRLEPVDREVLTQFEIDKITEKNFEIHRLAYVKDIFLFSCYTGLSYSDIKKLTKANIFIGIDGSNWIQVNRTKTNVMSKIPILPVAQLILDKYCNNPECLKKGTLLPVPSNQKYNAYLKEIADCCGINKNITTHIGRHTFATTITLNNNIPIETVSKMLGHRSIKTTEQYSKVLEVKISDDMSKLKEKFSISNKLQIIND